MTKLPVRIGAFLVFLWFANIFVEQLLHVELYPMTDFPMFSHGFPEKLQVWGFNVYARGETTPVLCQEWQMLYPLEPKRVNWFNACLATNFAVWSYESLHNSQLPSEHILSQSIVSIWRKSAARCLGMNRQAERMDIISEEYDLKGWPARRVKRTVLTTVNLEPAGRKDDSAN
jgi:hypothetical protein